MYNSLFELGIPMNLVRLIKMFLTEVYSKFQVGKNLSDMFLIRKYLKRGDALWPLLFNFVSQYAIRKAQENHHGLKLNDTHQLLVYTDDINILGGSIHTIKENAEVLIVASKEIGLDLMLIKLCTWSCLEIRMQDEVTI